MAFVAHDATHLEPTLAGTVRDRARLAGFAATAGEPDVDVDEHFVDPGRRRGVHRLRRVDRDRHSSRAARHRLQPGCVDGLVREQQVLAEAGLGHADDLVRGRAGEAHVADRRLAPSERSGLVGLHVRPQTGAGKCRGHRLEVPGEGRFVNDQGRSGQIRDLHRVEIGPWRERGVRICASMAPISGPREGT